MSKILNINHIFKLLISKIYIYIIALTLITLLVLYIDKFYRKVNLINITTYYKINDSYYITPSIYQSVLMNYVQQVPYLNDFIFKNRFYIIRNFIDNFKNNKIFLNYHEKNNKNNLINQYNYLVSFTHDWVEDDRFNFNFTILTSQYKIKDEEDYKKNINKYSNYIIELTNQQIRSRINFLQKNIKNINDSKINNYNELLLTNKKKIEFLDDKINANNFDQYVDLNLKKIQLNSNISKLKDSNTFTEFINKEFEYEKDDFLILNYKDPLVNKFYNIDPKKFDLFKILFYSYIYSIIFCTFFIIILHKD